MITSTLIQWVKKKKKEVAQTYRSSINYQVCKNTPWNLTSPNSMSRHFHVTSVRRTKEYLRLGSQDGIAVLDN